VTVAPCIYCRVVEAARTREHVVQASFGGALTLPTEVCADCNAAFSPLDKDLVEHVDLFARGRVKHLLGLGLQEDPGAGVQLTARLGMRGEEKGLAAAPPQLFRGPDGVWHFRGASSEALEALARELSSPVANVSERVDVDEDSKAPIALAVIRTAPGTFLVRGTNAAEVQDLARSMRETGMQVVLDGEARPWVPPAEVAPITIKTSFPVGSISRCLSKVALNYACALFGTAFVLDPAFDRVRSFARYGEVGFMEFVSPSMLDQSQQDAVRGYSDPSRHALALNQVLLDGLYRIAVQIVLYGKAIGIVRLSATPEPLLPLRTWRVSYFDHAKRTFEHLTVPDDGFRCFANIDALVPGATASLLEGV
jgi:hypothetical protein